MKTFDEQEFISDLDTLLLNIVYSSDDPEEQLEYFNSMFKDCLESNAPLQRVNYNSCGINSGRKPTRLALRSPGNFFGTSETS